MPANYLQILAALQDSFPPALGEAEEDTRLSSALQHALAQLDGLPAAGGLLGESRTPDYTAARRACMPDEGSSLEAVTRSLVDALEGSFNWNHPGNQSQMAARPTLASILAVLLPAITNPNLCSDETSRRVAEIEVRVAAIASELIGYDADRSAGLFTFGGTGAMMYGVKIGMEKALPGCHAGGLKSDTVLLTSDECHYCALNVAAWLGIGQDNVIRVATESDHAVRVDELEAAARRALTAGKTISAIVATLGTTDAFGIDDLAAIHTMRERLVDQYNLDYHPHIHADAASGWAWSVLGDYNFQDNPLEFGEPTAAALAQAVDRIRHLRLADSVAIDFHKTGFTPYVSSLVLLRERADLEAIKRQADLMPYLYQAGDYHPGQLTLETTRSAAGPLAAWANLLLFGKQGLRVLLGHAMEMTRAFRQAIDADESLSVLNRDNVGPVTLFRAYPEGIPAAVALESEIDNPSASEQLRAMNDFNRRIFEQAHANALAGEGLSVSLTECRGLTRCGEPITALKCYSLSPTADASQMRQVVSDLLRARAEVERQGSFTLVAAE